MQPPHDDAAAAADPASRRALIQRVVSSEAFERTRRLRALLLFVCERVLENPGVEVAETDIAAHVFGKSADFNPAIDTVVRVQASQLRKRLALYFATQGAAEPIVIDIPRGSYTPAFRERASLPMPEAEAAVLAEDDDVVGRRPRTAVIATALAFVFAASTVWLAVENRALRGRVLGTEHRPHVEAFWREIFGDGQPVQIVVADSNLTFFQDLFHRQLSPAEYQNGQFAAIIESEIRDGASRSLAHRVMNRQFTSLADTRLAHRLATLAMSQGIPTEIVHARRATVEQLRGSSHVVLSGSRRANPWIELFEKRLAFQSRFDETQRLGSLENVAPQPGEEPVYRPGGGTTYCRVAVLPNLAGTGRVLIISGTDLAATDAGTELLESDADVKAVRERVGAGADGRLPYFEVLLRARRVFESATGFEIIAHRVHGRAP